MKFVLLFFIFEKSGGTGSVCILVKITGELGYNVMKGTEYFVSL
jgi:hypothetical protein